MDNERGLLLIMSIVTVYQIIQTIRNNIQLIQEFIKGE